MPRLILASKSPARLATLRNAGFAPVVRPGNVAEAELLQSLQQKRGGQASFAEQVLALAAAKAVAVAEEMSLELSSQDVVIGCDTMLEFSGELLGKPDSAADAQERLKQLSGKSGVLYTGHWLISGADLPLTAAVSATAAAQIGYGEVSVTKVNFGTISPAEIDAYIATGEPLAVAGCFTIDGFGGPFIDSVEGCHHGVVGISLPTVRRLLAKYDWSVTDFWESQKGKSL